MPHLTVPAGTVLAQAEVMGRHLRIFDDPVGSGQFQQAFSEILDVMRAPVGRPTAIVMATVPGIRAGRAVTSIPGQQQHAGDTGKLIDLGRVYARRDWARPPNGTSVPRVPLSGFIWKRFCLLYLQATFRMPARM
jgi:hypothetical protein